MVISKTSFVMSPSMWLSLFDSTSNGFLKIRQQARYRYRYRYDTYVCHTHRLRRSQTALDNFEAALTRAEDEAAQGPEKVNSERLSKAQAAKKEKAAARRETKAAEGGGGDEEEEDEEVGEGDWERCTEESLAKALEEAKEAVNHSRSYLIGE